MDLAYRAATRSTCDRKHVGCVLVKEKRIISTGYNGAMSGRPHCDEVGHLLLNNSCVRTSHAEENAIVSAAKSGSTVEGSTCYVTASPCWKCFRMLAQSGVVEIIFDEFKANEMNDAIYKEMAAVMPVMDVKRRIFNEFVRIENDRPVLIEGEKD